jgi:hypothetical protein
MCAQTIVQHHKMGSAMTSHRDLAPTPHPRAAPSAFAAVRCPRHPPPEADGNPRPCSSRGRTRARESVCPLLWSGGPSATSVPRASYYDRGITPSSPLVGLFPYLSARPSSSRRPTSLPPFHSAAMAAAGKPSPCIASWSPSA